MHKACPRGENALRQVAAQMLFVALSARVLQTTSTEHRTATTRGLSFLRAKVQYGLRASSACKRTAEILPSARGIPEEG